MKIEINSDPTREEWDKLLKESSQDNFNLSWWFGEVSRLKYRRKLIYPIRVIVYASGRPCCLAQAKVIEIGFLPGLKTAFVMYGGLYGTGIAPLQSKDSLSEVLPLLITHIEGLINSNGPTTVYQTHSFALDAKDPVCDILRSLALTDKTRYTPIIDLTQGEAAIWQNMRPVMKRSIRQGLKRGVEIVEMSNEEGIDRFYELDRLYKKGRLFETKESFKHNLDVLINAGLMRLFFATVGTNYVSAVALLTYEDVIAYAIGAMDRKFQQYRPSNVLQWEVVKWGTNNGYKAYNMIGAFTSEEGPTHSITKFKLNFNPIIRELSVFRITRLRTLGINNSFLLALLEKIRRRD